jgi:hypothetical protein
MSSKITSFAAFFTKFEMRVDNLGDRVSVFEIVEVHSASQGGDIQMQHTARIGHHRCREKRS